MNINDVIILINGNCKIDGSFAYNEEYLLHQGRDSYKLFQDRLKKKKKKKKKRKERNSILSFNIKLCCSLFHLILMDVIKQ